jgi:hypothetical protein
VQHDTANLSKATLRPCCTQFNAHHNILCLMAASCCQLALGYTTTTVYTGSQSPGAARRRWQDCGTGGTTSSGRVLQTAAGADPGARPRVAPPRLPPRTHRTRPPSARCDQTLKRFDTCLPVAGGPGAFDLTLSKRSVKPVGVTGGHCTTARLRCRNAEILPALVAGHSHIGACKVGRVCRGQRCRHPDVQVQQGVIMSLLHPDLAMRITSRSASETMCT